MSAAANSKGSKAWFWWMLRSRTALIAPMGIVLAVHGSVAFATPSAAPIPTPVKKVWAEVPLATVVTGFDNKENQHVGRALRLAVPGPDGLSFIDTALASRCSRNALNVAAVPLQEGLDAIGRLPSPSTMEGTVQDVEGANKYLDMLVDSQISAASERFQAYFEKCTGRLGITSNEFSMALVQRLCGRPSSLPCDEDASTLAEAPPTRRFSLLALWLAPRDWDGPLPINSFVLLPQKDQVSAALVILFGAPTPSSLCGRSASSPAATTVSSPAGVMGTGAAPAEPQSRKSLACALWEWSAAKFIDDWPATPDAASAQRQFEALVSKARADNLRIEQNVPYLLSIPKEVAIRTVDVLDEPQRAMRDLTSKADAKLLSISDEIARMRLVECARYRGLSSDFGKVSECAGYKLTGRQELDTCLAKGACLPALREEGLRSVLLMLETNLPKGPSVASLAPRLDVLSKLPLEKFEEEVRKCAPDGTAESKAVSCVLDRTLGKEEKRMWECVKDSKEFTSKELKCALSDKVPPDVARMVECTRAHSDRTDQAICMAGSKLDHKVVATLICQRRHKSDEKGFAECMAKVLAKNEAEKLAACVAVNHEAIDKDWTKAAQCYTEDMKLPEDVAVALGCIQRHAGRPENAAACMAASKFPNGPLRQPVQCLAENPGSAAGAAVCMASDGLTPEQRIMLGCMVTAGEPISYGTCVGGQLAMKEVVQCANKKVFEGPCMGKNNALRMAVEALSGQELESSTLVGQHLNFQADIYKTQFAVAQATAEGATKLSENLGRETKRVAKNAEAAIAKGAGDIAGAAGGAVKELPKVFVAAPSVVLETGKSVERRVRRLLGK